MKNQEKPKSPSEKIQDRTYELVGRIQAKLRKLDEIEVEEEKSSSNSPEVWLNYEPRVGILLPLAVVRFPNQSKEIVHIRRDLIKDPSCQGKYGNVELRILPEKWKTHIVEFFETGIPQSYHREKMTTEELAIAVHYGEASGRNSVYNILGGLSELDKFLESLIKKTEDTRRTLDSRLESL